MMQSTVEKVGGGIGLIYGCSAVLLLFCVSFVEPAFPADINSSPSGGDCTGKYNNVRLSSGEIARVLRLHKTWRQTYETLYSSPAARRDGRRANLCGADLGGQGLSWADLRDADLRGAKFDGADLSWADLRDSDLRGADLAGAKLNNASLRYANANFARLFRASLNNTNLMGTDLRHADLERADLAGANLNYAKLSGARLTGARLTNATLIGTNVDAADFRRADLGGAVYETIGNPLITSFTSAARLEEIRYQNTPRALLELRDAFKESGAENQRRAITAALQRVSLWQGTTLTDNAISGGKVLVFGLPTQWGIRPSRALVILLGFSVLFAGVYLPLLRFSAKPPIVRVSAAGDLAHGEDEKSWRAAIITAIQFSVCTTLRLGGGRFSLAHLVVRLTHRQYTFRAVGWVRIVSGAQTAIGIFLTISWAATFFGHPFE